MTTGRLWLEIVPGAVAVLGGLVLMGSASRAAGLWAGWLTALAGAWFAIGPIVSRLWTSDGLPQTGAPVGNSTLQPVIEQIGFFTGLGVVIVFLAAAALGRFSVVGVRDAQAVVPVADEPVMDDGATTQMRTVDDAGAPVGRRRGLFGRRRTADTATTTEPVEETTSNRMLRRDTED